MGRLLDQWMQENDATLRRIGGMPPMGAAPEPAFGGMPQVPSPEPGFPTGAGPMAAPVNVRTTPGAEVGSFSPFQPQPMQAPALPAAEVAAGGGGPGAGSMVMDAIEGRRQTQAEGVIPEGTAGPGGIVEEGREAPEGEIRMPAEGEPFSAQDALEQTPEAVDKAVDLLEQQTGVPVEETYTQVTGNSPPADMKKREIGNFLFEFGLNLLAAPAGMSDVETFGTAAQQTITGRRGRAAAAQETESAARQQSFENRIKARELGLKEREIRRLEERGDFTHFAGGDGKMYSYDGNTGEISSAVGPDGTPITAPSGASGTTSADVQRFNRTFESARRRAEIMGLEFDELAAIEDAQKAMLRDVDQPRSDSAIRSDAMDRAQKHVPAPHETDEWQYLEPEEQVTLMRQYDQDIERYSDMFFNDEKYGRFDVQEGVGDGEAPDAARLTQGSATPVTNNETGVIEYWTLDADGKARKVTEDELDR